MKTSLIIVALWFFTVSSVAAERLEVALHYQAAGTYTTFARLGASADTEFLVDTGSSLVVLSTGTFQALAASAELRVVRTIRGALADGAIVETTVFELPELVLGDGCRLENVEAVTLPGADRNILGLSALSRLGQLTLAFDKPTLGFTRCLSAIDYAD